MAKEIKKIRQSFLEGIGVPEKKDFVPDDFQLEAVRSVLDGHDTLVIAPTGAGKTYIAIECIRSVIAQGKRAVYTTPLKALSNGKYAEFKKLFEPEYSVGLLTGDRKIDGDSSIVVATTEIYRNELYSYQENYALVILDELHYLADAQRGPVWEESIILSPSSSTLLALSASISNPEEIADWMQDVRRKEVNIVSVAKRPVELRLGFLHPDCGVIPLENEKGKVLEEVSEFYRAGRRRRGPPRGRPQGGPRRNRRGRKGRKDR